jgi:hypothetical protein
MALSSGRGSLAVGARALSWSADKTLRLWDIAWPKAPSLLRFGCELVRGDKGENQQEYREHGGLQAFSFPCGIALSDPICQIGVEIPAPDWSKVK